MNPYPNLLEDLMTTKTDQLKTVLVFAATLANCGAKASADSSPLARAADFLPCLEAVPSLTTLDGAELRAEWKGLSPADREALVADVAGTLDVGPADLNAKIDTMVDVGLDIAAAVSRGVAAWTGG